MRSISAIGPSYQLADRKAAVQRSVNLYLYEIEGNGEDRVVILKQAPGETAHITCPSTIRNSYNADGRWFVVAGNTLYEVSGAALVARGVLLTGSGYVGMTHGTGQLCVTDGDNGYVLTLASNAFLQITASGWLGSGDVAFLDGYFIFADPGTEQFYLSAIDDASSVAALDFSSADTQPDDIIAHKVHKRELYLFGSKSTEVWINNGGSDFPLTRYNATPIAVGIVGQQAVCIAADMLIFIGQTENGAGIVYMMNGYQPQRISKKAVEEALTACDNLAEARLWSYQIEGSEFIGVDAPGMETTWVWDAATREWHERARDDNGAYAPMDYVAVTHYGGDHYACVGPYIRKLDASVNTLVGDTMPRERTWPHLIAPAFGEINFRGLEVLCTTGHGGSMTLEISNDGGRNFGAPLQKSLGVTGRWSERIRWLALGASRDRVFRLRCTDDIPFNLYAASVDAS